jgi:hypothetical protein
MTCRKITWFVKCVWLTAGLTAWSMGLGSCLTEPGCWLAESKLLPVVGFLSFPSGPLLLILNNIFADVVFAIDLSPHTLYSVESLSMIATGYLQWFHVVPAVFGKQEFTALCLNQRIVTDICKRESPKPARRVQVRTRLVQPYDRSGRTPLERAIQ